MRVSCTVPVSWKTDLLRDLVPLHYGSVVEWLRALQRVRGRRCNLNIVSLARTDVKVSQRFARKRDAPLTIIKEETKRSDSPRRHRVRSIGPSCNGNGVSRRKINPNPGKGACVDASRGKKKTTPRVVYPRPFQIIESNPKLPIF